MTKTKKKSPPVTREDFYKASNERFIKHCRRVAREQVIKETQGKYKENKNENKEIRFYRAKST